MFIPPAYQIWKTLMQYLTKVSVSSKYRVEPESIKSSNNDILNWLSIIRNVTPSFESVSYNLHAPIWMAFRKRGVTFLICFRKRGVPRKGRSLRKWGGGSNPKGNYAMMKEFIFSFFNSSFTADINMRCRSYIIQLLGKGEEEGDR